MHLERRAASAGASYVIRSRDPRATDTLAAGFRARNAVVVPGLLRGRLLREVVGEVRGASFADADDAHIARESRMDAPTLLAKLIFLANEPRLIRFVQDLTRTDVASFFGRVYRFEAGSDHFDTWHDDAVQERRIAMSLNVGDGTPEGGELLLRRKGTEDAVRMPYGKPGDALLFRVSEHLEHRVLPVSGPVPRTAFVGWFSAGAAFPGTQLRRA